MNSTEYKSNLEEFMSNNHGITALHTFYCIIYTVQCSLFSSVSGPPRKSMNWRYMFEFFIIVLPSIAAHTFLSSFFINILNICMIYPLHYEIGKYCDRTEIVKKFAQPNAFKSGRIQTISVVRGLTYLITMLCILAVALKSFPRNIAKTENYWYSFMETVVGLFVLISGLNHSNERNGVVATLKSNTIFITTLLCLGVGKDLSMKRIHYHEHIGYGVNWHLFFTVAISKLLSSLLLHISDRILLLCIITLAIHEFLLYNGLEEWAFGPPLMLANREGQPILGYISMYLFGAYYKSLMLDKSLERSKVQKYLAVSVAVLWLLTYAVPVYRQTSLSTAGYCFFVEAIMLTKIMVTYFFEVVFDDFETPLILSAVNKNALTCFLVANAFLIIKGIL